jgi:hypothetical protein
MKNLNNPIGNRTGDILACRAVPHPTTSPHTINMVNLLKNMHILTVITRQKRYVQCYIVVRWRNSRRHGNGNTPSVFIVVSVDVAVNNLKVFSVGTYMEQRLPFALLSSYKVLRIVVTSNY